MSLGDLGDSVSYSIFGRVSELASKGRKVYPLAIGEPSFATPTPIIEAASASMKRGDTHYVTSYGIPEVRQAIQDKANSRNKISTELENTIFLPTKLSVYASVLAVSRGGGDVLIPDPGYFYEQPVALAGAKPVRYPLAEDYSLDLESVEKLISRRTRAVIVNTPSNPTGKMLGESELRGLLDLSEKYGIRIISDESYEDIVFEKKHVSIGSLEPRPKSVVSLFSLSKSFAMTGWRAGYAVAPKETVKLLNRFVEHTMSCFPPFIQEAAAFALRKGRAYTEGFRDELLARRNLIEKCMREVQGLTFKRTEGAFYTFPKYSARGKSTPLALDLLETTGVAVLPGVIFGPRGEGHLRISFAAPREVINDGMRLLGGYFEGRAH